MTEVTRRQLWFQNITFSLVILLLLAVVGYLLYQVEENNRDTNRATAYRLCTRDIINRAYQQSIAKPEERVMLERIEGLPILDCTPNLEGLGARPLSSDAQREFVRRWQDGELSRQELGICPNSIIGESGSATKC